MSPSNSLYAKRKNISAIWCTHKHSDVVIHTVSLNQIFYSNTTPLCVMTWGHLHISHQVNVVIFIMSSKFSVGVNKLGIFKMNMTGEFWMETNKSALLCCCGYFSHFVLILSAIASAPQRMYQQGCINDDLLMFCGGIILLRMKFMNQGFKKMRLFLFESWHLIGSRTQKLFILIGWSRLTQGSTDTTFYGRVPRPSLRGIKS